METMPLEFYANRWAQANIPIKFRGLRFDSYDHPHITGRKAREAAEDFVDTFQDRYISDSRARKGQFPENRDNVGKGLVFFGRNGTRKTTLSSIIGTEIIQKYPGASQCPVLYIRSSEWKDLHGTTFSDNEVASEKTAAHNTLRKALMIPLLLLDDLGQEYRGKTGFMESVVHELIRLRFESARPTIMTTNIDPESFRSVYNESFDSFRRDAFDFYPILGSDTRKD